MKEKTRSPLSWDLAGELLLVYLMLENGLFTPVTKTDWK
jgi:hypothetical protein